MAESQDEGNMNWVDYRFAKNIRNLTISWKGICFSQGYQVMYCS